MRTCDKCGRPLDRYVGTGEPLCSQCVGSQARWIFVALLGAEAVFLFLAFYEPFFWLLVIGFGVIVYANRP